MLIYKLKDSDLISKIFNISDDTHSMLTRKVITPCEYCTEEGGEESCGDCESSCQTSCLTGCQDNCEYYCQSTCQLACQSCDTCQNACQNTCQTTCEITCQDTCESDCQSCDTCQTTCQLTCQTTCQLTCQTTCESTCQTTCESTCQTTCQLVCQVCDTNQSKCVKQGQNITRYIGTLDIKVSKEERIVSSCYTSLINYINRALTICGYTDSQLNENVSIQHIFLDDALFDKIKQYANKIANTNIKGFQQKAIITSTEINDIQEALNGSKIPDTIPCCENSGYESCISRQL